MVQWLFVVPCFSTYKHRIFIKFFSILLVFCTSKLLEFQEFNKTIPFGLVGCETGYSQFGATCFVGYLYITISYSTNAHRILLLNIIYFTLDLLMQ